MSETGGEQVTALGSRRRRYTFVLSGPAERHVGYGVRQQFTSLDEASAALSGGSCAVVVGAVPFRADEDCALFDPVRYERISAPWPAGAWPRPWQSDVVVTSRIPSPAEHRHRVRRAVHAIHSEGIEKVVLARRLELRAEPPIDPVAVLDRLVAQDGHSLGYLVDLSGVRDSDTWLVGASPEILVRCTGGVVTCRPLAGSAPRNADPVVDSATANALLASGKDLREHAFVTRHVRQVLGACCSSVEIGETPQLYSTPKMWHLGTSIRGTLADPNMTALDLVRHLHPTPAVCGTPTDAARRLIDDQEEPRGFYAGAVGWCDAAGDGEWIVAIRCAEISDGGRAATAYAGGGIVAESDADAELDETSAKFATILTALDALDHDTRIARYA